MSDGGWAIFRVGLTGGIATGKSTVAGMFAGLGIPVVDSDHISRELVKPDQPALREITATFGPEVLQTNGTLDRRRLRDLVFADADQRQRLEAILHPRIRAAMLEATETVGGPYQLLVVPLLVETGFEALVDRVLVVDCPPDLQVERLLARDGENRDRAELMLAAQAGRDDRIEAADDVVNNAGNLSATRYQVEALHQSYLSLSGSV